MGLDDECSLELDAGRSESDAFLTPVGGSPLGSGVAEAPDVHAACQARRERLVAFFWTSEGEGRWTAVVLSVATTCGIVAGAFYAVAYILRWDLRPYLVSALPMGMVAVGGLRVGALLHPQTGGLHKLLCLAPLLSMSRARQLSHTWTALFYVAVFQLSYETLSFVGVALTGKDHGLDASTWWKLSDTTPTLQRDLVPWSGVDGQYPLAWQARLLLYTGWCGYMVLVLAWAMSLAIATATVYDVADGIAVDVRKVDVRADPDWEAKIVRRLRPLVNDMLPTLSNTWGPGVASLVVFFLFFVSVQAPVAIVDRNFIVVTAVVVCSSSAFAVLIPGALVTTAMEDVLTALNELRVNHQSPSTPSAPGQDSCMVSTEVSHRIDLLETHLLSLNKHKGPGFKVSGVVISTRTIGQLGGGLGGGLMAAVLFLTELYALRTNSSSDSGTV